MVATPRNIGAHVRNYPSVRAVASTGATHNGVSVDRMPAESDEGYLSGVMVIDIGAATGAPTALTVNARLQDSADGSAFADIATTVLATSTITAQTAGSALVEMNFDASQVRRYLRAQIVTTLTAGTSPTIPVSGTLCMGGAQNPA